MRADGRVPAEKQPAAQAQLPAGSIRYRPEPCRRLLAPPGFLGAPGEPQARPQAVLGWSGQMAAYGSLRDGSGGQAQRRPSDPKRYGADLVAGAFSALPGHDVKEATTGSTVASIFETR